MFYRHFIYWIRGLWAALLGLVGSAYVVFSYLTQSVGLLLEAGSEPPSYKMFSFLVVFLFFFHLILCLFSLFLFFIFIFLMFVHFKMFIN
jgi:hypothetical protein